MHVASLDITIRTGEVDIFHCTHGMTYRFSIELTADTMVIKCNDLTRFHITDIFCSDHIECTGLTRNHIAIADLADCQRMETIFITACIHAASCHHNKCKCTVNLVESILDCIDTWLGSVYALLLDEVSQNLSI